MLSNSPSNTRHKAWMSIPVIYWLIDLLQLLASGISHVLKSGSPCFSHPSPWSTLFPLPSPFHVLPDHFCSFPTFSDVPVLSHHVRVKTRSSFWTFPCRKMYPPGWRRSSVVRTSVSGRRTFPALRPHLRLTCDHLMGKVSANQSGQLSLPSFLGWYIGSNPCNCVDYGVETIILQTGAACGSMAAVFKVRVCTQVAA